MLPDLEAFLVQYTPMTQEREVWGRAQLGFHVTCYLGHDLPPLDWITSVRCVVFRGASVLVVRDPERQHFLPGGRRESGETLTETLRRELLEETGWTIHDPCLLGWRHCHHLSPKPPGYRYPYPDFLQLVYTAEAAEHLPEARESDGDEIEAVLRPIAVVQALELSPCQHLFLNAALRARCTGS
jgi:8-oxo-dGTP pyrophosphatase MutT (NUDIX family)